MKTLTSNMSEYDECVLLSKYLHYRQIPHAHIPNETFTKSWSQKAKNKAMGVSSGIPDYIVITNKELIFIEMKKAKGGVVSGNQKWWLEKINDTKNVKAFVCNGFDEARAVIESFEEPYKKIKM